MGESFRTCVTLASCSLLCFFFFDCTRLRKLIHKTRSCKKHELVSTSSLSPRILFNETMMIGEFVFNEDCIKSIYLATRLNATELSSVLSSSV